MPFVLWARMACRNHVSDKSPEALRDVAMVTNFGTQFAITGILAFGAGQPILGLQLLLALCERLRLGNWFRGLSGRPTECRYCRYLALRDVAMAEYRWRPLLNAAKFG